MPSISAARLPRPIEERLIAMTRMMKLEVAGVDLRRTPAHEWYCFEVNPSPGFTFYDTYTGQNLAHKVASHLLASNKVTAR